MSGEERRLVNVLEGQLIESDTSTSEVGEQRERNHRYYAMQPLGNEKRGRSHYISPDVLDSVENKKALFKETFLKGRKVVQFDAVPQNPDEADAKTAYAEIMLKRNQHAQLFRDGWHDAFVAKRMVVLVTWKSQTKDVVLTLEGATQQQVMQLLARQQASGKIVGIDQTRLQGQGGRAYGDLVIQMEDSYVDMELVQPERYFRDPGATYPDEAEWNAVEEDVSRGYLRGEGYDPEQIDSLKLDYRWRSEEEEAARKSHDQSWTRRRQGNRISEHDMVTRYRTWTWLNLWDHDEELAEEIDALEGIQLYEIHWCQGEILRWEDGSPAVMRVDEQPVVEWTEYKISHAEHGMADADVMAHSQKVNSVLKRLVIDNQQQRNNPRWLALMNSLKNPRELMGGQLGGITWAKRQDAVMPLPTPDLSPLTLGVLGMISQDNDRRSGFSDVAKGMNTDVIRYQNAEGLIDKMTTAGTRRPMSAVRDWAETFLVPLTQKIVRIGMENDTRVYFQEAKGRQIQVAPSTWIDDDLNMAVAKALTPEEGIQLAQQLLMLHQIKSQDPDLKLIYTVKQKHALFDQIYDALGITDTTAFMLRPDSPEFAQALQRHMQQQQMLQQAQMAMQQEQQALLKSADRRAWEELQAKLTDQMADNLRADDELRHKKEIDWEEINIERDQKRAANIG